MLRTHQAGALRADHVGQTVTLTGWVAKRRDHGGVAFVDLRDASGIAQVVARDEVLTGAAHDLRNEYCISVTGEVVARSADNVNADLPTGQIEVVATGIEVLNASAPLPFQIDERVTVGEEARLKYRYLDLRRPGVRSAGAAIRLRSKVNAAAREVLGARDFVEIETPTLTRSTPEGARDFLVPARLSPGAWYALPQSPQLFKQLLMVAGMERYYQIARCYRDEDFRADRQPEFTQLDIEMSFVEQDDILALGEEIAVALWKLIGVDIPTPLPRLTYAEAMARFGTDKPDTRFGQELVDCTAYFADTAFRVFQADYVGAVVMPGGASQPRKTLDAWQEFAKQRGARGLAYVLVQEDGELGGPVAKNLSDAERAGLAAHVGAAPGDCVFFAAGVTKASRALLGAVRLEIAKRGGLIAEGSWSHLWVLDAPLFEPAGDAVAAGDVAVGSGAWTAVHHAFTSPKREFIDTFDSSATIRPSRSTFASTDAAATEEQRRSALIIVVTGGVRVASDSSSCTKPSNPTCSGAVSQSWLPSRMTRSGVTGSAASARTPASRNAAMIPIWSISTGEACPTACAWAHRRIGATMRSRAGAERSLESRTPAGAERHTSSMTTTPTLTGPARAPRPTSSIPANNR